MTHEERAAHVLKIEKRFARRLPALRRRLFFLAMVGYAGMFAYLGIVIFIAALFLLLGIGMPLESGWIFLVIGSFTLTFGGWAAIRVLWVRLTPPEGRILTRREGPELFKMLDGLCRRLRASGFHQVIITAECNAAVSEIPRLGVFGFPRHYLQLGLPLIECLSADEVRAVLAHELAHLSARDGWLTGWIYRQRKSWDEIFKKLRLPQARGAISFRPLLIKFIDWFWPRFNSHAWVLSRYNEFQADAAASWAAGAECMAGALYRLEVYQRLLSERFWPELWKRANGEAIPPDGVFAELREALRSEPREETAKWRGEAFNFVTSNTDTHPCLTARLKAIKQLPEGVSQGHIPQWPLFHDPSAADTLLGPALERIRKDVEARWRKESSQAWMERHARAVSLQHRLASLSQVTPNAESDVDSLWDQAHTIGNLQGDLAAIPILRQILALRPEHPQANFYLGRCLLDAADATGEACLERIMEQDEEAVPQVCGLLHAYFRRTGQADRVREIESRMDRHEASISASKLERGTVTAADTIIAHECKETDLDTLREVIAAEPQVTAAYLGRKQMRHFKKQPLFVLCVAVRRAWHRLPDRAVEQAIARRLFSKVRLPGRVLVFAPGGSFAAIARKLRAVPGSKIFARGDGELRGRGEASGGVSPE